MVAPVSAPATTTAIFLYNFVLVSQLVVYILTMLLFTDIHIALFRKGTYSAKHQPHYYKTVPSLISCLNSFGSLQHVVPHYSRDAVRGPAS